MTFDKAACFSQGQFLELESTVSCQQPMFPAAGVTSPQSCRGSLGSTARDIHYSSNEKEGRKEGREVG